MHRCPHCQQEMNAFAFYCIRCQSEIGKVDVDGVMIATFWFDKSTNSLEKIGVKTLKQNSVYKDIARISPPYPVAGIKEVTFTLTDGRTMSQRLLDFYKEASSQSQEWNVS